MERAILVAAVALLGMPAAADCGGLREFTGRIQQVSRGPDATLVVRHRMKDELRFRGSDAVPVVDRRGTAAPIETWAGLTRGLTVTVCWKLADDPLRAHRVIVKRGSER